VNLSTNVKQMREKGRERRFARLGPLPIGNRQSAIGNRRGSSTYISTDAKGPRPVPEWIMPG